MIRRPVVAGSFYAGTRERLEAQLGELCSPGGARAEARGAIGAHPRDL